MNLINIELLKIILDYGIYAMGWGALVVAPSELLVFGVLKAFRLLKL